MHTPVRRRTRIVPQSPITVAIDDVKGLSLCYGVVANISDAGACVWTNGALPSGTELLFRVSFANPPEVHELRGVVVWEREDDGSLGQGTRRFGVEWRDATCSCAKRLHDLATGVEEELLTPSQALRAIKPSQVDG